VIEIDGVSYENKWDKDVERQEFLERAGLTVLRFDDKLVKRDIGQVAKPCFRDFSIPFYAGFRRQNSSKRHFCNLLNLH
jgi:hypothetical protein